jgi:hypothetical protein
MYCDDATGLLGESVLKSLPVVPSSSKGSLMTGKLVPAIVSEANGWHLNFMTKTVRSNDKGIGYSVLPSSVTGN